jgi:hypothetical protein
MADDPDADLDQILAQRGQRLLDLPGKAIDGRKLARLQARVNSCSRTSL